MSLQESPISTTPPYILAVEDQQNLAGLIELNLKILGFKVKIANDGRTGLALALTDKFDCILLDLMLPELDGISVCKAAREAGLNTSILMLTAKDTEVDKVIGLESGADDYLTKPFSVLELQARVKALLRQQVRNARRQQPNTLSQKATLNTGYLYIVIGGHQQALGLTKLLRQPVFLSIGALFTLAFASLFGYCFLGIIKPIHKLMESVTQAKVLGQSTNPKLTSVNAKALTAWQSTHQNEFHQIGSHLRKSYELAWKRYRDLQKVESNRKEMLAHLSHDIKTPLASVMGYLETLIHHDHLDKATQKMAMETAFSSTQQIKSLIDSIFELATLNSPSLVLKQEVVQVDRFLASVANKIKPIIEKKQITLLIKPLQKGAIITGDPEKIERIFANLIENAVRHTEENGQIQIRYGIRSNRVLFQIQDTGCGIPKEDIPHIFKSHFKAGNSIRSQSQHGGLGLAITKRLVELHQSQIKVASELGKGTCFQFGLPIRHHKKA